MRPVRRGNAPRHDDFTDYKEAKPELVSKLGLYCSFCERRVVTLLAVEHIQPKSLPAYASLIGRWSNFLLACTNCNSTKGDKDVVLAECLLPDRDNTFAAFRYLPDGTIEPSDLALDKGLEKMAKSTLNLTGLDRATLNSPDSNGKQAALDRMSQRMETWLMAKEASANIQNNPKNDLLRESIIKLAVVSGFFSVWMTVFVDDPNMRLRLISAFAGTNASGCFDSNGLVISPAPNPDKLENGGKL